MSEWPHDRARAITRTLLARSYVASKYLALARMSRRHESPTVVFSMGKTGSTAIARAIGDATDRHVFQVFRLEPTRLREAESRYRARPRNAAGSSNGAGASNGPAVAFPGAYHLWESEHLVRHPPAPEAPWTVITTVREPIAQAVSAFFHSLRQAGALEQVPTNDTTALAALRDRFVAEAWVRAPLRWFEREFRPAVGLDPFGFAFDPDLGNAVVETPPARLLLLRQENLADAPKVLASFLGLTAPLTVPRRNDGATGPDAEVYRRFLAEARLPASLLDEAYGSEYAQHFYGKAEIAHFRQRWSPK